jgi:hypothetical protein
MDDLLQQVLISVEARLYFLALAGTLIVPDIAGAVDQPGAGVGTRYRAWFTRWVADHFPVFSHVLPDGSVRSLLTAEDCYQFRCSLLHQAVMPGPGQHTAWTRLIFVETPPGSAIHYNLLEDAIQFDVRVFCQSMVQGARDWIAEPGHSPEWNSRFEGLIRRHPNGLAPYVVGLPVIA